MGATGREAEEDGDESKAIEKGQEGVKVAGRAQTQTHQYADIELSARERVLTVHSIVRQSSSRCLTSRRSLSCSSEVACKLSATPG
jgi:hypothetical protein